MATVSTGAPPTAARPNYGPLPAFVPPAQLPRSITPVIAGVSPAVIQADQAARDAGIERVNARRRNQAYLNHQLQLNRYQLRNMDQYGNSFREQLDRNRDVQLAGDRDAMRRRGLTNSTLNNQRGVYADSGFQKRSLEDQLLGQRQALVGQRGAIIAGINDPTMSFNDLQRYAAGPTATAAAEQQAAAARKAAQRQQWFDLAGHGIETAANIGLALGTGGASIPFQAAAYGAKAAMTPRQPSGGNSYIPSGLDYQPFNPGLAYS